MCVDRKLITVPSKVVSFGHHKKLFTYCNCGRCSECRRRRRIEWSIRSQYEFRRCLDNGGYVLFDCLTYDEEHIPYLHDHYGVSILSPFDRYCFNRKHLRYFFVRLRRRLSYLGYKPERSLRYFVAGEYGEKNTERCHYHLLLFVNCSVEPLEFSKLVADCWPFGRTDGFPFKSKAYTLSHNVISDSVSSNKVANYVSKYVNKPYHKTKELVKAVRGVFDWIHSDTGNSEWMAVDHVRERYDSLLKETLPFHLQSKGFGEYALSLYDDLADSLSIPLVNKDGIRRVSLPSYYFRRLFYDVKNVDGVRRWIPNKRYRDISLKNVENRVKAEIMRCDALLSDLRSFEPECYRYAVDLLNGRDLSDFVEYKLFYKFRSSCDVVPDKYIVQSESLSKYSYFEHDLVLFGVPYLYGYHTRPDFKRFKKVFFSRLKLPEHVDGHVDAVVEPIQDCDVMNRYVYNQNSLPDWYWFDDLDDFLDNCDVSLREYRAAVDERNEIQQERYENLFNARAQCPF